MATAGDIATDALMAIGIVGVGRAPTAEEMQRALTRMRRMFGSWELEGVRLGDLVGAALTTTTVIPLPESHLEAVEDNLAARLAREFGRQLDPSLVADAARGFQALQAAYIQVPIVDIDPALRGDRGAWPWGYPYV